MTFCSQPLRTSSIDFPVDFAVTVSSSMSRSVAMRPGCTAFTRIPSGARSFESVFSIPCTAARIAFDRMRFRYCVGWRTDVEVEYTIEPFDFRSSGSASRVSRTADIRVSSTAACHFASSRSSKRPGGGPPAFTMSESMAPNFATASRTKRSQPAVVARSATIGSVCAPVLSATSRAALPIAPSSRLHMATFAPSRPNSSAIARPSPLLAAATSTVLPFSPRSISLPLCPGPGSTSSAPAPGDPCGSLGRSPRSPEDERYELLELELQSIRLVEPRPLIERDGALARPEHEQLEPPGRRPLAHGHEDPRADPLVPPFGDREDAGHIHPGIVRPRARDLRHDLRVHRRDDAVAVGRDPDGPARIIDGTIEERAHPGLELVARLACLARLVVLGGRYPAELHELRHIRRGRAPHEHRVGGH